jgi:hypothetical protein
MSHPLWYTIYMKMKNDEQAPTGRCEDAPCCGCCSADGSMVRGGWNGPASWERQTDMNGDVYIRENEDYLDRD